MSEHYLPNLNPIMSKI